MGEARGAVADALDKERRLRTSLRRVRPGRLICSLLVFAVLVNTAGPAMAAPGQGPSAQGATVVPGSISVSLAPGESATARITVTTASTPIPKVDVLFLFDVTNSMAKVLESAKTHGVFVMNALRTRVADSAFGVASFADYPGHFDYAGYADVYGGPSDYPWRLGVDITTDTLDVQRGIEALQLLDGKDGPEAYSRALFEALYLNWRPAAKHIIVLFGDSVPHDPDFFSIDGQNFGVDPGLDAITGTADDLGFEDVVAQVRDREIEVIPINSDLSSNTSVQAGFDYMAGQTGGQVYPLDRADALPEVVAAGLTEATSNITSLTLVADHGYEGWVSVSPADHQNVGGGETRTFDVVISAPADALPGRHTFHLTAAGDLADLATTVVNVSVGGIDLDPAKLRQGKDQLIQNLSAPTFETEFGVSPFKWTPPANDTYADEERVVKSWLDGLSWGELTPAELAAVHRVTIQEEALWSFMRAQAETSHIGNAQLSRAIGQILSCISLIDLAQRLAGKSVIGLLVTKLRNYAVARLISLCETVILWCTERLPREPEVEAFRASLHILSETFQERFENALKKQKITDDLLQTLLLEAMVQPMDQSTNSTYVSRTRGLISDGLARAQQMAQTSIAPDDVGVEAAQVARRVSQDVGVVEAEWQSIKIEAGSVEEQQAHLSTGADIARLAGYILTITTGGFLGTVPAQVGHVIAVVLNAIDVLLSVDLGYRSYDAWWSTPQAAAEVTKSCFASSLDTPWDVASEHQGPFVPRGGLTYAGAADAPILPPLSDYTLSRLANVKADAEAYASLLDQLAAAVTSGDVATAETIAEQLLAAGETLGTSLLIARQPLFAGAGAALDRGDVGFPEAYSGFGRAAAAFDGQDAILYLYLMGWFSDPSSADYGQLVHDQIAEVKQSIDRYQGALADALPYVEDWTTEASVLVTGYTLPDLRVGETAMLRAEITNSTPTDAESVTVTFSPGRNAKATTQTLFSLGSLGGGASATIEIPFAPLSDAGLLTLSTSTGNGSGTMRTIPFAAVKVEGTGGLGMVLVLLILAAGAVAIVVIRRRQQLGWTRAPGTVPTAGEARLQGLAGSWAGQSMRVTGGRLTIGRGKGNDVRLVDGSVSRRHAVIRFAQGRWFLQDSGSRTGTFVNGQRVGATTLRHGDHIQIGSAEFVFYSS